jgi:hypothetical protein
MAKLKDLAGLAALGMLGYKLSQGKDNTTAGAYPTGVMGGARTPVASDSMMDQGAGSNVPRPGQSTITGDQVNPDADTDDTSNYGNEGMRPVMPSTSSTASKPKPRVKPPGMSGSQSDTLARVNQQIATATPSSPIKTKPKLAKLGTGVGSDIEAIANPITQEDKMRRYQRDAQMAGKYEDMKKKTNLFNANPAMEDQVRQNMNSAGMKRGGAVKKMASGGMTSSASKRADGIATKGKTRGRIC